MNSDFKPARRQPAGTPLAEEAAPEPVTKVDETIDIDEKGNAEPENQTDEQKPSPAPAAKPKGPRWYQKLTRKQWIIIGVVAVLLLAILGYGGYRLLHHKKLALQPASQPVAKAKPAPTTETSNLTGLQVAIGTNKLPVTGVMIENSTDARPQSGLSDAGVVFEAIAEGGITRFLTLFQSNGAPSNLGPVRSARPYYLDYLSGFDAAIAHVGGSPDALNMIKSDNIKDLDQFFNADSYHRITTRPAPHNVYTSLSNLYNLQKSKGFSSSYTGFPRKTEQPLSVPTAKTIDFSISSPLFSVHYDYNTTTHSYDRSEGGAAHIDANTNQPLSPKVVIAIIVAQGIASDGDHTTYQDLGSGKAYIFQDGGVTIGTWTKTTRISQISFQDSAGKTVSLNPGQTWISLVGTESDVSYKP